MSRHPDQRSGEAVAGRPWYREPWPWVAIAIPAAAVIAGAFTYYLAVSNPDYLVVEEQQYEQIRSELRGQPPAATEKPDRPPRQDGVDGKR